MKPVKTVLQFEEGTSADDLWAVVGELKREELIRLPVVVAKFAYIGTIVDRESAIVPLLRICERVKCRIEFRFE
jgi:hypothetical protein